MEKLYHQGNMTSYDLLTLTSHSANAKDIFFTPGFMPKMFSLHIHAIIFMRRNLTFTDAYCGTRMGSENMPNLYDSLTFA